MPGPYYSQGKPSRRLGLADIFKLPPLGREDFPKGVTVPTPSAPLTQGYGGTRAPGPGADTPAIPDMLPALPFAIPNVYTPDIEYDSSTQKPVVRKAVHYWFEIVDIGVNTRSGMGNAVTVTSPLTIAALAQVFDFQDTPQYVMIGIHPSNGANAELRVWIGDGGGHPVRIGNGGSITVPMNGEARVTYQAFGQSIKGTIIAISGYDPSKFNYNPGTQA